ncbi:hypothetical protein AKO1_011534 [Acrasis kona]|uniref:CNH domain-containing protein n=1 Tax=Acrasis kona TaxID=1008807 RepID=A0AAW2Z0C5_9EUKA
MPVKSLKDTRGTTCFALNKNNSHQLVAHIKKKLVFIDYKDKEFEAVREMRVPVPEAVLSIEWMKKTVCLNFAKKHFMLNYETGEQDDSLQKLQLINIMSEEYSNYTCFVHLIGTNPTRDNQNSPVQWSDGTALAVGVCFPYVVGVSSKVVEIYNVYERHMVDKFDSMFEGNGEQVYISDSMRRLYIAGKSTVWVLTPQPIDKQIEGMIEKNKVLEAISMFEKTFQGTRKEKEERMRRIDEMAGYANFFKLRFKEAADFFYKSRIDTREIISFFEDLKGKNWKYTPKHAKVNDIKEICKTSHCRSFFN